MTERCDDSVSLEYQRNKIAVVKLNNFSVLDVRCTGKRMSLEPLIHMKKTHQKFDISSQNFCRLSLRLIRHLQLNSSNIVTFRSLTTSESSEVFESSEFRISLRISFFNFLKKGSVLPTLYNFFCYPKINNRRKLRPPKVKTLKCGYFRKQRPLVFSKLCGGYGPPHLCPGFNASIVKSALHIWQGYLTFSCYFIFNRIVCVLVTFYQ